MRYQYLLVIYSSFLYVLGLYCTDSVFSYQEPFNVQSYHLLQKSH